MRRGFLYSLIFSLVFLLYLLTGRYLFLPLHPNGVERTILVDIRLPRAVAVSLSGAALATAGLALQNVFRNPLAGPNIVGVTSGSAFGAVLAILYLGFNPLTIQLSAFIGGILALVIVWRLQRLIRGGTLGLVLVGMAVSALFQAFVGFAKYVADPYNKLPAITFWLLGSFAGVRWGDIVPFAVPMLIGTVGIILFRWPLNVMSLGDEARALGLDVGRFRTIFIGLSTLSISATTAVAGMVGWVGLIAPHVARLTVGHDNRSLAPAIALAGAVIMLICDDIARSLTPGEIPIGVVTSLVGGPLLLLVLSKSNYIVRRRW
ncbi:FecCD family ABC transporter permease [Thermococcus prieurii]